MDYQNNQGFPEGQGQPGFAPQNPEQQNVNQGQQPVYNQAYNQVPYQQGPVEQPTYDPNFQGQPQYQQPAYQGENMTGGFVIPQQDGTMPQYAAPEQPMPVYEGTEQGYPATDTQGQQAMPVYQEPVYQEPVYQQPAYQGQQYQQPVYQEPVYQQPVYQPQEAPAYGEAYAQPADQMYSNNQTEYNGNNVAGDGFVVPGADGFGGQSNGGYQMPPYNGGAPVDMNNAFANGTGVQKDTLGLISMIAGIVSIVCCCAAPFNFIAAIAAVVLGILAMRKCKSGKAVAGLITGGIAIVLSVIFLLTGSALTEALDDFANEYGTGYEDEYDYDSEYTEDDLEYYYDSDYEY